MDLSLLSPEVQAAILSANFDQICDMAQRVRGKDNVSYRLLQQVIEAYRNWSDFELAKGPDGIEAGAQIMVRMAGEHHIELPLNRAKELVRLVYLFHKTFKVDPENFFHWIIDQTLQQQQAASHGPIDAR